MWSIAGSRVRSGDVVVRANERAGVPSAVVDVSAVVARTLGTMALAVGFDGFRLERRDLRTKATRADARATMETLGGIVRRARAT